MIREVEASHVGSLGSLKSGKVELLEGGRGCGWLRIDWLAFGRTNGGFIFGVGIEGSRDWRPMFGKGVTCEYVLSDDISDSLIAMGQICPACN